MSKLVEVFAVRELGSILSKESKSAQVIVNCMTPGACKSEFDRESTGVARFLMGVMRAVLARTTEVGSRTLVAGLTAVGEDFNGSYMADSQVRK